MDSHQKSFNKQILSRNSMDCHATEDCTSNQAVSKLSSDIVEVTNVHGGVGFVAVGRLVQYPNHSFNHPHQCEFNELDYSMNTERSTKGKIAHDLDLECSMLSSRSDANLETDKTMMSNSIVQPFHLRHNSEPLLNVEQRNHDSSTFLRRTSNTSDLTAHECSSLSNNNTKEVKTNKKLKNMNRIKAAVNANESSLGSGGSRHSNKRSRKVHVSEPPVLHKDHASQQDVSASQPSSDCSLKKSHSYVHAYPLCKDCGQRHRLTENHEYDYVEEVDDDLQCDICLQPFVDPYDTKCGHTFCCVCLKNYVRLKKMCPVDRKDLNFSSSDCWQSSLVLRKLVNKLTVHCPNTVYCKLTLPRSDLVAHLKERCPGTLLHCPKAMYGCTYKGPRKGENDHLKLCKFQHLQGNPVDSIYPDCVKHVVELFRPEGMAELGLSVVGGNDTPLRNIIIQSIIPGSLVAQDGRIRVGDIIIHLNGEDLHNVSHVEARTLLSRSSHLMRFTLLREKVSEPVESFSAEGGESYSERIAVSLLKPPSDQLGIKITTSDDGSPGIYILDLVPGRVAHANGQLRVGDRILEISHIDLWNGNPEVAARIIQSSGERVDIVISRTVLSGPSTIMNPWATDKTLPRTLKSKQIQPEVKDTVAPLSIPVPESFPIKATYKEKVISVKKSAYESLGIIVAGGTTGLRGDLPVFVQDVQPLGVLGKDKRLQRGDLLVQVNGVQLNGLSNSQAIAVLKDTAQHCKEVGLVAIELDYVGKDEDFALWEELSGVHHQRSRRASQKEGSSWSSWTPSWKMWLAVPPLFRCPRDVVIKRNIRCGLGFSIVGGRSEKRVNLPIFIKYVVPNGPAAIQGGVRCGDEIIAINGREAATMTHSSVVQALKSSPGSTLLTIMSWPGSVH